MRSMRLSTNLLPRSRSRSHGFRLRLTLQRTMQASAQCRRFRSSSLRFVHCARISECRRKRLRRSACIVRRLIAKLSQENADMLSRLARVSDVELAPEALSGNNARSTPGFDVAVLYERQIDVAAERERLNKELAKYDKGLAGGREAIEQSRLRREGSPAHH